MNDLIESIRVAVSEGATAEHKAIGAVACRTLLAALDTVPGKALAMPNAAPTQAGPRVSVDQVLDLMIARLTSIASEHDRKSFEQPALPGLPPPKPSTPAAPEVARGLRVPVTPRLPIAAPRKQPQTKPTARPPTRRKP